MTDLATIGFRADTRELESAEGRLRSLETQGASTEKSTLALAKQVGGLVAAYGGFRVVQDAVQTTIKFEHAISELSAITGATGDTLKYLSDQAKDIGRTTTLSASQAVDAFKLIASAKPDLLENAEALSQVTREAVLLSEAAGLDLASAASSVGTSLNQFGAEADQAARFVNVLAAGAKFGASEIAETSEALKNSGAAANAAGVSFEAANSAIQGLAAGGIKAAEAGTGLRNVILILEQQTDQNLRPSVVGLTTAIENLADEQLNITELTKMFGRENAIAAQTLVDQSASLRELETNLTGSSAALEQARTNTNDLEGDLKVMGSAVEAAQIAIGSKFTPALREVAQATTGAAQAVAEFAESDEFDAWMNRAGTAAQFVATAIGVGLVGSLGKGIAATTAFIGAKIEEVAATHAASEAAAVDAFQRNLQATAALNAARATEAHSVAEVANTNSVLASLQAERALEGVRLQAQITEQGRAASIARLAELRMAEVAMARNAAAAETSLAAAQASTVAAETAATASAQRLVVAQAEMTAGATAAATASGALNKALMLVGGPAGATVLAVAGIVMLTTKMEDAAERAERLRSELSALSLKEVEAAVQRFELERDAAQGTLARMEAASKGYAAEEAAIEAQKKRIAEINGRIGDYNERLRAAAKGNEQLAHNTAAAYVALIDQNTATKDLTTSTDNAAGSVGELSEETLKARQKIDEMIVAQKTELSQLQMTDLQREISNKLIEAGANRTGEQTVEIIRNTTELHNQRAALEAATAASDLGVDAADRYAKAQMDAYAKTQQASKEAAQKSEEDWRLFRNSMSDFFADLMMEGGNAWDNLAKSAERAIYKMVGDVATSGLLSLLTGEKFDLGTVLGNSGTAGKVLGGVLDIFGLGAGGKDKGGEGGILGSLGSIFGGGKAAADAAGAAAGGGLSGMLGGIGSSISGMLGGLGSAIAGAGSAVTTALAAIPGWGWALAGAGALVSQLDKSTPSYNAGILLHDVSGVSDDRKFAVDQFDSGLTPVGFNRRTTEAEASKVVDSIRAYDTAVTELRKKAGIDGDVGELMAALSGIGLDEKGEGSGVFVGVAGESGGGQGKPLQAQINDYVRAYFSTFTDELSDDVAQYIMSGSTADEMIARASERIGAMPADGGLSDQAPEEARSETLLGEIATNTESMQMLDQINKSLAPLAQVLSGLANSNASIEGGIANLASVLQELSDSIQGMQRTAEVTR